MSMTQFEAFCHALKIDPNNPRGVFITPIDTRHGKLHLVEFPMHQAIKDPDAKPGEFPWRTVRSYGALFLFLNGEYQSHTLLSGTHQLISVTERNLLDDLETLCRKLENRPEEITKLLHVLDDTRRRDLDLDKRGITPS